MGGKFRNRLSARRGIFDQYELGSSQTQIVAAQLTLGAGQPLAPPAGDYLLHLQSDLVAKIHAGISPNDWPLGLLSASGWVILDLLGRYPDLLFNDYLAALEKRAGVLAGRILLYSYLRLYPRAYLDDLRAILMRLLGRGSSAAAGYRYENLSQTLLSRNGPQLVARRLFQTDPAVYLTKIGLTGELARGRFFEAIWESLAATLAAGTALPNDAPLATRIFLALSLENNSAALRFPKRRSELANGLLTPWIGRGMDLPLGIRNLLATHIGDPRLPSEIWGDITPPARAVLYQAFAGEAIADFFLFLESLAPHDPAINPYRHDRRAWYWDAWKRGLINDAWIAFGSLIGADAQKYCGARAKNYAIINKTRPSALLIFISGICILEWSHSPINFLWYPQNPTAPQLYKLQYQQEEFTNAPDQSFSHSECADFISRFHPALLI